MAIDEGTQVVDIRPRMRRTEFEQILTDHNSPAAAEARAGWRAIKEHRVDPLFALAIFHQESQFGHGGVTAQFGTRSPGNTRTSRLGFTDVVSTPHGPFVRYPTWADGWRDVAFRLVDPTFVYVQEGRRTIRPIIERFAPPSENDTEDYIRDAIAFMNQHATVDPAIDQEDEDEDEHPTGELVFGRVPHPPFERRIVHKTEGVGFDFLGSRRGMIVGTCVHMMEGTLIGSENHFANPSVGALTDYGIGGAHERDDGSGLDGVIFMWNDPEGDRTPWASGWGPEGPGIEGHGQAFLDAYPQVGDLNRRLVSIELSGHFEAHQDEVTPKQFESLCHLVAHWHDRAGIPWHVFPRHPVSGVVTQMQHFEFAQKACPGAVVRARTSEYQERVRQIMRQHQEA